MYPEYDPAEQLRQMVAQGIGGAVSLNNDSKEDRALGVRFIWEPRENPEKSKKAGRLICDEIEICEIKIPGSTDLIRNVVSDRERERFPKQYAAFKDQKNQDAVSGTPLSEWPLMSRAQVEEARFFGVRTVEHLSEVSDGNMQRLGPGWVALRQKAKDWLAQSKDGAVLSSLRSDNDELRNRVLALEKMLKAQAEALHSEKPAAPSDDRMAALEAKLAALADRPEPVVLHKRKYTRRAKPAPATEV